VNYKENKQRYYSLILVSISYVGCAIKEHMLSTVFIRKYVYCNSYDIELTVFKIM